MTTPDRTTEPRATPDAASLVQRAEESAAEETGAIHRALAELVERAERHAAICKRLTACKAEADRLHKALKAAGDGLESPTNGRPPDPSNGEHVNGELAERVKEARGEAA